MVIRKLKECKSCKAIGYWVTVYCPAIVMAFLVWLMAFAEPLEIDQYHVKSRTYQPGAVFELIAVGKKAKWAARNCVAISAETTVQAANGVLTKYANPTNYNDGTVRMVLQIYKLPVDMVGGTARVWDRIIYRCFGFYHITITSPKAELTVMAAK